MYLYAAKDRMIKSVKSGDEAFIGCHYAHFLDHGVMIGGRAAARYTIRHFDGFLKVIMQPSKVSDVN